jgi:uncharacterized membrane protein YfcA
LTDLQQLWSTGVILLAGSILQGAVGFAYALFAVPLLIWTGVPLSHAVALVTISVFVQVGVGAYRLRDFIRWREVLPATFLRYLTIPLGIGLLVLLDTLERDRIRQIIGMVVLLVLLVQVLFRVRPRERLHGGWRLLAFSSSGIIHGMAGMGGPPVVLWVAAHRWPNREIRAFLFTLFLLTVPVQVSLLLASFGQSIVSPMVLAVAFSPLVAMGSAVGVRLGDRMGDRRIRLTAYWILLIVAVTSILAPLLDT